MQVLGRRLERPLERTVEESDLVLERLLAEGSVPQSAAELGPVWVQESDLLLEQVWVDPHSRRNPYKDQGCRPCLQGHLSRKMHTI